MNDAEHVDGWRKARTIAREMGVRVSYTDECVDRLLLEIDRLTQELRLAQECEAAFQDEARQARQERDVERAIDPAAPELRRAEKIIDTWAGDGSNWNSLDLMVLRRLIAGAFAACRKEREAIQEKVILWHQNQRPILAGPEYGLASEEARRTMRETNRFHEHCADELRKLLLYGSQDGEERQLSARLKECEQERDEAMRQAKIYLDLGRKLLEERDEEECKKKIKKRT